MSKYSIFVYRLLHSFVPRWPSADEVCEQVLQNSSSFVLFHLKNVKSELYGPSMIVFTLAAILIYQMKLASHSVVENGYLFSMNYSIFVFI